MKNSGPTNVHTISYLLIYLQFQGTKRTSLRRYQKHMKIIRHCITPLCNAYFSLCFISFSCILLHCASPNSVALFCNFRTHSWKPQSSSGREQAWTDGAEGGGSFGESSIIANYLRQIRTENR